MDDPSTPLVWDDQNDRHYQHGARRQFRRWPLHAELEVPEGEHRAVTINASAGGLRLASDTPLPEGQSQCFLLRSADGETVELRGRVVWQRPSTGWFLAGLAFDEPMVLLEDPATFETVTGLKVAA